MRKLLGLMSVVGFFLIFNNFEILKSKERFLFLLSPQDNPYSKCYRYNVFSLEIIDENVPND